MLYREIIAVYSQIHTKHINTLCGQNAPGPFWTDEENLTPHRDTIPGPSSP